jgi:hypothetical protein
MATYRKGPQWNKLAPVFLKKMLNGKPTQRNLVTRAIEGLTADSDCSFSEQTVADNVNTKAYEDTFKQGAMKVTILDSVTYHLAEMAEINMLKVSVSLDEVPKPTIPTGKSGPASELHQAPTATPQTPAKGVNQTSLLMDMARNWYGYGRWDAPFWFIGPEPGMDPKENNELWPRYLAWMNLGGGELVDAKEHHFGFGFYDWHCEIPPARPQSTWSRLIRLLLSCRNGRSPDPDEVLAYQKQFWGMRNGETCVIELCSLAANKLSVAKAIEFNADELRTARIAQIQERIAFYKPLAVVMYRRLGRESWSRIAGREFSDTREIVQILNYKTLAVFADHPVSKEGVSNEYWDTLGSDLRQRLHG